MANAAAHTCEPVRVNVIDCLQTNAQNASEQLTVTENSSAPASAHSPLTAQALVSREVRSGAMLTAQVLLAGQVVLAHLDSCATHCFLSSEMSRELTERGYPPQTSPVVFEVTQGNPLCDSTKVHYLPMSIVRADGIISTWERCLFVVADAGAPYIICYAVLRLGGIVNYEPPAAYIDQLMQLRHLAAHRPTAPPAGASARLITTADMLGPLYHSPVTTTTGMALETEAYIPVVPTEGDGKLPDDSAENCRDLTTHHGQKSLDESTLTQRLLAGVGEAPPTPEEQLGTQQGPKHHPPTDPVRLATHDQLEQPPERAVVAPQVRRVIFSAAPQSPRVLKRELERKQKHYESGCSNPDCWPVYNPDTGQSTFITQGNANPRASALNSNAAPTTKKPVAPAKRRKGDTDMLSEENPYGKNPPLPEEVMEAVKHLKLLANPSTTPEYTPQQLEEVQKKLGDRRPNWANALTLQHMAEVADKETEQFITDMMDKPKYQTSIFAQSLAKCCDLAEFEMHQKPGRDMWTPPQPRRFKNPNTTLIVDAWQDALLDNKKCHESKATHPAVVTVVLKDMRDPRVCVDYRNRNARTEVPVFPMPDVHDFLEDAAGFQYYCSFDMAKMFNQFRIKKEHQHLAAFITHRGVYEPDVIMFGLAGGPQHAVRECGGAMATDPLTNGKDFTVWAMEQNAKGVQPPYEVCPSLGVVKGSRLRPFIDDVNIPSNHKEGMKKLVELFFEFCHKHNLILSRKKAQVMKTHLRMLGFVVSAQGKHLDPQRIITLLEAKKPRSKEALHSLLCSYTFVRMFIPNFASIVAPLHEATKGIIWKGPQSGRSLGVREVDPEFIWTPEMTRAYDQLRNALLEAPILVKVDWSLPLFLSVDASLRGEGWVLWQLITTTDGSKVAVAILYGSRKYTESERNWETTRQEASAIRSALTDVEDYVFGQHFYLFSDHLNLRFMHNSVNRAVIRMRDFLSQFNMTVVHCPGIWNNADSISRLENEHLPTDLAQHLNSATEAKLQGVSTRISIGTCTQTDVQSLGSDKLQPRTQHDNSTIGKEERSDPNGIPASALCSAAHSTVQCATCLLCHLQNVDFAEADHDDTLVTVDSQVLHTAAEPPPVPAEEGYDDFAKCLLRRLESPIDLLQAEACNWNSRFSKNPRVGIPAQYLDEYIEDVDEEDIEEVLWCGPVDRKAVVFRSAAAAAFRPNRPSEVSIATPQENDDNIRITISNDERIVEAGIEQAQSPKRVRFADEQPPSPLTKSTSRETQTTPADFRIAKIQFPMMNDFIAIHNNESGHHGLEYSYRKLIKRCGSKWANERGEATKVKAALRDFIEACPICQKVRGLKEKVKAKHSFIVSRPFIEVSYDFIVFRREDKNGCRYLIVAIDNFLKIVEMKPVQTRDAETVARFLLELQSRYGPMARLRCDREGAFTGLLIDRLNKERGVEQAPCVPYHPQANSICERQNGIIMNHLNSLILGCALGPESKVAWSDLIPMVFSLVNNTPKNPLGISPLSMVYGVFANYDQPLLPTNQANKVGSVSNPEDYVEALMAWQSHLLELAEEIQSEHFKKLNKKLNSANEVREFHVGDFVLQDKKATNIHGKPSTRWVGPFLVMDRRDNDPSHPVLDLMNLTDMRVKEASIEDCRRFNTSWFDDDSMLKEMVKLAATDDNEYVVERIISHRPAGETRTLPLSKYTFEVKWQDFTETTWEPYSGLKDLEPLEEYAQAHPGLKLN